jgi:hypothetical protein
MLLRRRAPPFADWGADAGKKLTGGILMNARPATIIASIAVLATLSGCTFAKNATYSALGWSGKEKTELGRMTRAERAEKLSDAELDRRVDFLTEKLDENRLHAAAWKYGWLVVNAGGGIAAAVQAAVVHNDNQPDHQTSDICQAVKGAIGVTYLLLNPMPGTSGADPVRELPNVTHEDKMARLGRAEYILAREAERAHSRTSWWLHFGNFMVNAILASPVLARGNQGLALQNFGIGFGVGEAQIWTQPWEGPKDWEDYERFVASEEGQPASVPRAEWQIVPNGAGLAVVGRF